MADVMNPLACHRQPVILDPQEDNIVANGRNRWTRARTTRRVSPVAMVTNSTYALVTASLGRPCRPSRRLLLNDWPNN